MKKSKPEGRATPVRSVGSNANLTNLPAGKLCSKAEFVKIVNDPNLNGIQKLERATGIDLCLLPNGEPSYKTFLIVDGILAGIGVGAESKEGMV